MRKFITINGPEGPDTREVSPISRAEFLKGWPIRKRTTVLAGDHEARAWDEFLQHNVFLDPDALPADGELMLLSGCPQVDTEYVYGSRTCGLPCCSAPHPILDPRLLKQVVVYDPLNPQVPALFMMRPGETVLDCVNAQVRRWIWTRGGVGLHFIRASCEHRSYTFRVRPRIELDTVCVVDAPRAGDPFAESE